MVTLLGGISKQQKRLMVLTRLHGSTRQEIYPFGMLILIGIMNHLVTTERQVLRKAMKQKSTSKKILLGIMLLVLRIPSKKREALLI